MIGKVTLFHELTALDPGVKADNPRPLTPASIHYFMLKKGHVMEYYRVGPEDKKVVALFFGPMEYVLPSHADFSTFVGLDNLEIGQMTHGDIFRGLRKFPDAAGLYRAMQREYKKKVDDRIYMARNLTPPERFNHLLAKQPWVLDLAEEKDVANYLAVSVGMLRELRGGRRNRK